MRMHCKCGEIFQAQSVPCNVYHPPETCYVCHYDDKSFVCPKCNCDFFSNATGISTEAMKLGIGACNPKGVRTQILRLPGDAKKMNQATEGAMPFYSHSPFELVVFFKSLQKLDPETKTKVLYLWLHIQSAYMSLPLPFLKSEKDYVSMSWWLGYPVEIDIQIPPKGKNLWICITKEPYQWCSGVAQTHFPDWTRPWFEKLQTFVLSRTNEPT